MPGRPKTREDLQRLLEDQELGEDIFERLEDGASLTDICKDTGLAKAALNEWLESPERTERLARARARAADTMVEQGRQLADELPADPSPGQVGKAKLQVSVRQWIAERWNRPAYGQRIEHNVQGQITHLHLEALKRRAQLVQRVEPEQLLAPAPAQSQQVVDSIECSIPHTGSNGQ